MKSMCLAALTGALAISSMAVAIDVASAATRYGVYRGGVNRVGVARVGVGRVGIGYGRAGVGYGRWAGYRPGYGLGYRRYGLGAAAVAGAAVGAGYYAGGAYDAYASGDASAAYATSDVGTGDAYILHGTYISETDAVAYCAQQFRSYDIASRTFVAYSGERVSCPQ
jgi:BA14K-like protein